MTTRYVNGQSVITYSAEELLKFVEYLRCHGRGLSAWEESFIKDMEQKTRFSEKQAEIIERIYAEKS